MGYDETKRNVIIKKGLKAVEKLQFIVLILASLILIAGVDLITGKVGWSNITDPYFYISNVVTDAALLLITFGTVYLVLDYLKESDETYLKAKNEINDFATSKNNVPSILSRFLEHLNRKRKINQFEYNTLYKLYKLENRKKWYAYIPIIGWFVKNKYYYTEEEMHIWNFGTEEEKRNSKYCRKRKIYEEELNKEMIEKTIDSRFVRYDKITTSILLSEHYSSGPNGEANEFVTKNETTQIARFRIPTLLFSFGITFLITSLILDSFTLNWMALITISTKALSVAWNMFTSYRYAKKHFKNITLHDMLFRRSIIAEYMKWLGQEASAPNGGIKYDRREITTTPREESSVYTNSL